MVYDIHPSFLLCPLSHADNAQVVPNVFIIHPGVLFYYDCLYVVFLVCPKNAWVALRIGLVLTTTGFCCCLLDTDCMSKGTVH